MKPARSVAAGLLFAAWSTASAAAQDGPSFAGAQAPGTDATSGPAAEVAASADRCLRATDSDADACLLAVGEAAAARLRQDYESGLALASRVDAWRQQHCADDMCDKSTLEQALQDSQVTWQAYQQSQCALRAHADRGGSAAARMTTNLCFAQTTGERIAAIDDAMRFYAAQFSSLPRIEEQ